MTIGCGLGGASVETSPTHLRRCGLGGASVEASPTHLCRYGLGGASVEASPTHLIITYNTLGDHVIS